MARFSRSTVAWTPLLSFAIFFQLLVPSLGADPAQPSTSVQGGTPNTIVTVYTSTTAKPSSATSSSTSKTSSSAIQTHTIAVGNGDHKFKPDVVQANVGDIIEFDFFPANHSVVRAEWQFPCIPYEMTGQGKSGFFSGFHPVSTVLDDPPKYTVRVNDSDPIFFYCSAPGSCIHYGMVGVINPNSSTSIDTQRQIAKSSSYMLQPGEPFPPEGSPLPPASSGSSGSTHSTKLSTGAIVGIAVACLSIVVLGSLLFFFWGRFRGLEDELKRKNSTIIRSASPRSPAFPPPQNPSSSCAPSPMTAHTARTPPMPSQSLRIPPPYYPSPPASAHPRSPVDRPAAGAGINRSVSTRSVGGTFDLSPTGYYTRTHEADDSYKLTMPAPHASDLMGPVDPKVIPVGPYGQQMQDLQRANRSPNPAHSPFADHAATSPGGRPTTFHVNRAQGPAEMPDTSKPTMTFI